MLNNWRLRGFSLIAFLLGQFLFVGQLFAQPKDLEFIHYSNKDGLPSSYVKDIAEDQYGFIWLANRENICRFDGYEFQTFPAYDSAGLPVDLRANTLHRLADSLLVGRSIDGTFYEFDYVSETFQYCFWLNKLGAISQLIMDENKLWLTRDNQLYQATVSELVTGNSDPVAWTHSSEVSEVQFFSVKNERIAIIGQSETGSDEIHFFAESFSKTYKSPFPSIAIVYLDSYQNVWISNEDQGLCKINTIDDSFEFYSKEQEGNQKLLHNFAHVFEEDKSGTLWIGTEGGLCRWTPAGKIINRSEYELTNPNGLSSNPIYSALCDKDGNVWLGMYFSGINLWSNRNQFFKTISSGLGSGYLSGNTVSSFDEDTNGHVWVGLEDMGVNQINAKTGKITKYPIGIENGGLSYGNVHDLHFENDNRLWIATYTGGINILNTNTGTFQYINDQNTPELGSNNVYSFIEEGDTIYITTINGVTTYSKSTQKFGPFYPEVFTGVLIESTTRTPRKIWFSSRAGLYYYDLHSKELVVFEQFAHLNGINFIKADSENRLWIGDSFTGLYCYDESTGNISQFSTSSNGFPGTWIYGIQEGVNGWYWVSTEKGLVKLDPETGVSFLYNKDSGIPYNQFNYRAAFKDSRGIIYFGSNEGLIYFDENNQPFGTRTKPVVFTRFKLFNQQVAPDESEEPILHESLTTTEALELSYSQNVFTIEFSALNYVNKGKCHYAYYLEGFENDYNYVGNQSFATYTNLSPGTYTFKVKASLDNTTWEEIPNEIEIVILPPFWMSKWGYALYGLILAAILVLISVVSARIQKSKALAEIEQKERIHAVEVNQIKLEFFTNISHELRTPLTLIIGPMSKLLVDEKVSPFVKKVLSGMNLNAHRLLQLLNQLLDFRKIEQGKEELKVTKNSISDLFSNLEQSFALTAENNKLRLTFDCQEAQEPMWFDASKVEKILINLISNSFKFTEAEGSIEVVARISNESANGQEARQQLNITVRDTGKGMEPRVVNRIFDRYYQSGANSVGKKEDYYGSGIGLAFVQGLVQLHRGRIHVRSRINVGTIFKVQLPVSVDDYQEDEISQALPQEVPVAKNYIVTTQDSKPAEISQIEERAKKPKILLVEDNEELIEFIASSLRENYQVLKSGNGAEALEILSDTMVDLIICDVMMPVMDGFEFTTKVKSDFETSHIPLILLTAKSGPENKFHGLRSGADFYIEKPFLSHILEQNILNVLNTRVSLIKKFKRDAFMPVTELTHSDSDRVFLDKLTKVIKDNIDKPDLDVGFLTSEIGLSRSMLHIKLKTITDSSATEFINMVRLKEALQLMSNKNCNVSEAAYRTGFSSPTYFTRRFKQYYGQSPRDFLQREANE